MASVMWWPYTRRQSLEMLGRILIGVVLGVGAAALPRPLDVMAFVVFMIAVGAGIWSMRKRPCVVCGSRDSFPATIDVSIPYKPRAWWDLRPPSNANFTWLCWYHAPLGISEVLRAIHPLDPPPHD